MNVDDDDQATELSLLPSQEICRRFVLLNPLGRGGFAQVWRAHDIALDKDVAVKVFNKTAGPTSKAFSDFKTEFDLCRRFENENIIKVFDLVHESPYIAFSMEIVDGNRLCDLITPGTIESPPKPLPLDEVKRYLSQIVSALHYLHSGARDRKPVVHSDVSPRNIMVMTNGCVKLLDFGISRAIKSPSRGFTPAYTSPQQYEGRPATRSDDIYSLGAVLYHILSSSPPVKTPWEVLHKVPLRISEVRQHYRMKGDPVPDRWEEVIACCLSKERGERPESVRDILDELELELSGSPIGESRSSTAASALSSRGFQEPDARFSIENKPADLDELADRHRCIEPNAPDLSRVVASVPVSRSSEELFLASLDPPESALHEERMRRHSGWGISQWQSLAPVVALLVLFGVFILARGLLVPGLGDARNRLNLEIDQAVADFNESVLSVRSYKLPSEIQTALEQWEYEAKAIEEREENMSDRRLRAQLRAMGELKTHVKEQIRTLQTTKNQAERLIRMFQDKAPELFVGADSEVREQAEEALQAARLALLENAIGIAIEKARDAHKLLRSCSPDNYDRLMVPQPIRSTPVQ